jgi:hypothetical protein
MQSRFIAVTVFRLRSSVAPCAGIDMTLRVNVEVTYRQSVSRINQIFEPELSIHVLPLCFHLQTLDRAGLHPRGVEHPGHAQKEIALSLALIVDSASARG